MVDAFFLAARGGDFDALIAVLDPDVVPRLNAGARHPAAFMVPHGAPAVARQARIGPRALFTRPALDRRAALVKGAAGAIVTVEEPMTVMDFTVAGGRIIEIDAIADPERVRRIAAALLIDP